MDHYIKYLAGDDVGNWRRHQHGVDDVHHGRADDDVRLADAGF